MLKNEPMFTDTSRDFYNNIHDEDAGNGSLVYKEESNFIF